jgi:hypothetical protein
VTRRVPLAVALLTLVAAPAAGQGHRVPKFPIVTSPIALVGDVRPQQYAGTGRETRRIRLTP